MQHTPANSRLTGGKANGGRSVVEFGTKIRSAISQGDYGPGDYLPTVRELSRRHRLACSTVHRALQTLVAEGLLAAESRQGYRVLPGAGDPMRGCPVAYVFSAAEESPPLTSSYHRSLLGAFQGAAAARGWTLLSTIAAPADSAALLEKLRASRAAGLVLDMHDLGLIDALLGAGLPAVLVNSWREDVAMDTVMQDGQQGGLQAAAYLAGRGHRRMAWFGPMASTGHGLDRFGGALLGLRRAGLPAPEEHITAEGESGLAERARRLLSASDRPSGVIALWQGEALALARAAAELNLSIGKDFEMVGWCREEEYEESYAPRFRPGEVPPTVVWSAAAMAEAALDRISLRRSDPAKPALRIKIPTRLRMPEGAS
jgi:DNA-binding LacI/PurR family transcriptional regulator